VTFLLNPASGGFPQAGFHETPAKVRRIADASSAGADRQSPCATAAAPTGAAPMQATPMKAMPMRRLSPSANSSSYACYVCSFHWHSSHSAVPRAGGMDYRWSRGPWSRELRESILPESLFSHADATAVKWYKELADRPAAHPEYRPSSRERFCFLPEALCRRPPHCLLRATWSPR